MLRSKIRTLGFALLGNNRTDDGGAPPTTAEDEAARIGAGGWGRGQGNVEVDSELEELIRSDHPSGPERERPSASPARPSSGSSKYHTVGSSTNTTYETPVQAEETSNGTDTVGPDSEGYYELCIKSVEAVNWDPESEGPDSSLP
jgi:NADH dehydrogenase [ubiquinone] 1 alpha subcomplex assembly factor 1